MWFFTFLSNFTRHLIDIGAIDIFKIEISISDISRKIKQRFYPNAMFILAKTKKNFTWQAPDCYVLTLTSRDTHVASSRHVLHSKKKKKRKWKCQKERDIYVHKCISSFKNFFFLILNLQLIFRPNEKLLFTIYTFFINLIFISQN